MSITQGESLKIETSVLKVIEGLLCSTLPKIFEPLDRKKQLNNTVFSSIGNGTVDDEVILKNLKETLITTFLEHVKKILVNQRKELVYVVTSSIVDHAKLVDEKIKLQNKSL